jgi:hypothetical protein
MQKPLCTVPSLLLIHLNYSDLSQLNHQNPELDEHIRIGETLGVSQQTQGNPQLHGTSSVVEGNPIE